MVAKRGRETKSIDASPRPECQDSGKDLFGFAKSPAFTVPHPKVMFQSRPLGLCQTFDILALESGCEEKSPAGTHLRRERWKAQIFRFYLDGKSSVKNDSTA